jgi:hypothetical protein
VPRDAAGSLGTVKVTTTHQIRNRSTTAAASEADRTGCDRSRQFPDAAGAAAEPVVGCADPTEEPVAGHKSGDRRGGGQEDSRGGHRESIAPFCAAALSRLGRADAQNESQVGVKDPASGIMLVFRGKGASGKCSQNSNNREPPWRGQFFASPAWGAGDRPQNRVS